VLIAEHRHDTTARFKDPDDLAQQPPLRILNAVIFAARIITMLADEEHAIDRQLVATQRQRPRDRVIDRKAVLFRQAAAHIIGRKLIDIGTDELQLRKLTLAIERISLHQPRANHIRMRIMPPDGRDYRYARKTLDSRSSAGKGEKPRRHDEHKENEEA